MPPNHNALASLLAQQQCQPIYTSLDSGNSQQAIKQADDLLRIRTTPSTTQSLARALKALALFRLRRNQEAISEAETVLTSPQSPPVLDPPVLTPIAFVLSRCTEYRQRVADLLDATAKNKPSDEPLAVKAFEALIANQDYLKAQQLALRMHKSFASKKSSAGSTNSSSKVHLYFWWSMQCYRLLATETPTAQGAPLALTLAQRLIQRHIEEFNFDAKSDEDIQLYVAILRQAKQQEKALQILATPPATDIINRSLALSHFYLDLLVESQQWDQLREYTQSQLDKRNRNWIVIEKWILAVVQLANTTESSSVTSALSSIDTWHDGKTRDFPLAKIALVHNLRKHNVSAPNSLNIVSLLDEYFTAFSTKPCCYQDVVPYLDSLSSEEKARLHASNTLTQHDVTSAHDLKFTSESSVVAALNATKICARLQDAPPKDTQALVTTLLSAFYTSLPVSAKQPKTVPRPGADFVLMACQLTLATSCTPSTLLAVLTLLNHASIQSPASYSLKLLALRVHLLLGNWSLAKKTWDEVKIRGIQNESLGWLWLSACNPLPSLSSDATPPPVTVWTNEARELYRESQVETLRSTMTAFERGNYSVIGEFCQVRRRLQGSVQRAMMDVQGVWSEKKSEDKRKKGKETIEQYDCFVRENSMYVQWDTSVLPSVYTCVASLVSLTERKTSDEDAALMREMVRVMSGGSAQEPSSSTSSSSQSSALSQYLADPSSSSSSSSSSTALTALLTHIRETLVSSSNLPWKEQHLATILVHLRDIVSQDPSSSAAVDDTMRQVSKHFNARSPPSYSYHDEQDEEGSPSATWLFKYVDGQKGGIGVREKVIKDAREEVGRWSKRVKVFASKTSSSSST